MWRIGHIQAGHEYYYINASELRECLQSDMEPEFGSVARGRPREESAQHQRAVLGSDFCEARRRGQGQGQVNSLNTTTEAHRDSPSPVAHLISPSKMWRLPQLR